MRLFQFFSVSDAKKLLLFVALLALLSSHLEIANAQNNESLLKKRIADLEAENQALRKVISEIQGVISSLPPASKTNKTAGESGNLKIVILNDDWGDSSTTDMRRVCISAAESIWKELKDDRLAPILVSRSKSGPISLYKRGRGYEYQVRLDTANRAWAQCAFQFAHEFCHILCNYRSAENPQLWFEETLCEVASLYALRSMGETWKTKPPYSNWKPYSTALKKYADSRIAKYDEQKESVVDFYKKNKSTLEKNGTDRQLNGFVAVRLLPIFEKDPSVWQAIRYINLGPKEENQSFQSYLKGWHGRVPDKNKKAVGEIAKLFDIEVK